MNVLDAFESYGLPPLDSLTYQIFIVFGLKVPTLLGRSAMKKGLMSSDMPALVPERVVVCTLPTRWPRLSKCASSSESQCDHYMM